MGSKIISNSLRLNQDIPVGKKLLLSLPLYRIDNLSHSNPNEWSWSWGSIYTISCWSVVECWNECLWNTFWAAVLKHITLRVKNIYKGRHGVQQVLIKTRSKCWCDVKKWTKGFAMKTSANGNIFRVTGLLWGESPVTGEFPAQGPVTQSFDVFFDLRLNKRVSNPSRRRWFETPCAHYDVTVMWCFIVVLSYSQVMCGIILGLWSHAVLLVGCFLSSPSLGFWHWASWTLVIYALAKVRAINIISYHSPVFRIQNVQNFKVTHNNDDTRGEVRIFFKLTFWDILASVRIRLVEIQKCSALSQDASVYEFWWRYVKTLVTQLCVITSHCEILRPCGVKWFVQR